MRLVFVRIMILVWRLRICRILRCLCVCCLIELFVVMISMVRFMLVVFVSMLCMNFLCLGMLIMLSLKLLICNLVKLSLMVMLCFFFFGKWFVFVFVNVLIRDVFLWLIWFVVLRMRLVNIVIYFSCVLVGYDRCCLRWFFVYFRVFWGWLRKLVMLW